MDVLLCNPLIHQQSAGPQAESAFWSVWHLPWFFRATGLPAKYLHPWRRGWNTFHSPTSSLMLMKCPANGFLTCGGAEWCSAAADLSSCCSTGHTSHPSNYHPKLAEEEETIQHSRTRITWTSKHHSYVKYARVDYTSVTFHSFCTFLFWFISCHMFVLNAQDFFLSRHVIFLFFLHSSFISCQVIFLCTWIPFWSRVFKCMLLFLFWSRVFLNGCYHTFSGHVILNACYYFFSGHVIFNACSYSFSGHVIFNAHK